MEKNVSSTHPLRGFHVCPKCGSRNFLANTEKSKHCEDCGFEYFLNPSGAVAAFIVNERGELLVERRGREPAIGTLDLPGGFTDIGETAEESVAREVEEETGLKVCATRYLFSLPNQYTYAGMMIPTLDLFFECRVADTTGAAASDDAAACYWIPLDQLQAGDFGLQSIRKGVQKYLDGVGKP